jgi:hypothetical protein
MGDIRFITGKIILAKGPSYIPKTPKNENIIKVEPTDVTKGPKLNDDELKYKMYTNKRSKVHPSKKREFKNNPPMD